MTFTAAAVTVLALALPSLAAAQATTNRPLATRAIPLDQLCGARATLGAPASTLKIAGGHDRLKTLFGPGETVLIAAGSNQGLKPGQQYLVRRIVQDRFAQATDGQIPRSIHTAGWITIGEVNADTASATVTEACDGVVEGDYLEPLILPLPPSTTIQGTPDFQHPAHIIIGDERRQVGAYNSLMVIDRGSDHGLRTGQRLTIFRETMNGKGPITTIGDAVVVTTYAETSLMRIVHSKEAVYVGDKIAIHR